MGQNRRYPTRPIPAWAATVGACRRNRVRVRVKCTTCGMTRAARLKLMERDLGDEFSLWDRRPPCPVDGCAGLVMFRYSPAKGSPFRPMTT